MSSTRRPARLLVLVAGLAAGGLLAALAMAPPGLAAATARTPLRSPGHIKVDALSAGARTWFSGPATGGVAPRALAAITFGSNIDANDPSQDVAGGQSETAIAASGTRVLTAWNDISGVFFSPSTDRRASVTGVGYSGDGGATFTDLIGLPNPKPNQQWSGDPSIVAVDANHFIVSSLYLPSAGADCTKAPARLQIAVSVATVGPAGVTFGAPVVVADGGDACAATPGPTTAFLDKSFMAYDATSRVLAVSFTSFSFTGNGTGSIEIVRASVPADPAKLRRFSFSAPVVVWPEELTVVNQGSYPAVAPNGDVFVSWERNIDSALFDGDPYVYIHAAKVARGATAPAVGGPASPRVVSRGQVGGTAAGGVKSMGLALIPGYSRGLGNDFPRIAYDRVGKQAVVVWNDASAHPLGDIWMRALPPNLALTGPISKVNDDASFALHFLPAVSVRSDGSIATSWYDRRAGGPMSTLTDYAAEIRPTATTAAADVTVSTGPTDWAGTSSLINPNFGDYTDNASSGTTTYFTWSDGRIGVPQPFVDHR